MKKLQNLGRSLTKDEQKSIMGGDPPEGCNCDFYYVSQGTCGVRCGGQTIAYGMAQWEAQQIAGQCGYYWCCESC